MSIPTKIERVKTLETDFGTSVAEGIWKKIAQLENYLNASYPVGMLMFWYATQSALPESPDSNYWKHCDGTAVSNSNSPMNGVTIPDLRNKFFRHPVSGDTILASGGADSLSVSHNHGGNTGIATDRLSGSLTLQGDTETGAGVGPHFHPLSTSNPVGGATNTPSTVPTYIALQVYIRIV